MASDYQPFGDDFFHDNRDLASIFLREAIEKLSHWLVTAGSAVESPPALVLSGLAGHALPPGIRHANTLRRSMKQPAHFSILSRHAWTQKDPGVLHDLGYKCWLSGSSDRIRTCNLADSIKCKS